MGRLNIERQIELEPERLKYDKSEIEKKGYLVEQINSNELQFEFKGSIIKVFPYSGWCTGKTIQDCRGIRKLLKQI